MLEAKRQTQISTTLEYYVNYTIVQACAECFFNRKTALNTCKQLCENGGKSLTLRCHISKLRIMKTCKFVSVQSKYICAVKLLCLFKGVIVICSPPFPGI